MWLFYIAINTQWSHFVWDFYLQKKIRHQRQWIRDCITFVVVLLVGFFSFALFDSSSFPLPSMKCLRGLISDRLAARNTLDGIVECLKCWKWNAFALVLNLNDLIHHFKIVESRIYSMFLTFVFLFFFFYIFRCIFYASSIFDNRKRDFKISDKIWGSITEHFCNVHLYTYCSVQSMYSYIGRKTHDFYIKI